MKGKYKKSLNLLIGDDICLLASEIGSIFRNLRLDLSNHVYNLSA